MNPDHATVLQLLPLDLSVKNAVPVAEALRIAGQLIAEASQAGVLSAKYVVNWIGMAVEHDERQRLFRRIMRPDVRFHVPLLGGSIGGWWFQIARRLLWVTNEMEDEGRLLELLLGDKPADGKAIPLAATEPVLIVARMTRQPVDWAFAARIWPEGAQRPTDRRWSILANAVHGHGIPTITPRLQFDPSGDRVPSDLEGLLARLYPRR